MTRSALPVPTVGEVTLYVRSHGVRRAAAKLFAGYVAGREQWYVTVENLLYWVGVGEDPGGLELRAAVPADLPRMRRFTERQHPDTLRAWCRDEFVFFIALVDGEAVSYRCLARRVPQAVADAVTLSRAQTYMVDEFTAPDFRRRGITRRLAVATNPILLARGLREVVGLHRTDNENTIAATRAKNIATIGRLTRTCLGGWSWFRYEAYRDDVDPPLDRRVRRRATRDRVMNARTPTARTAWL